MGRGFGTVRHRRLGRSPSEGGKRGRLDQTGDVFASKTVVSGHDPGNVSICPFTDIREGPRDFIGCASLRRRTSGQRSGDHDSGGVSLIRHDPTAWLHDPGQVFAGELILRHDIPPGSIHLGDADPTGEIGGGAAIGRGADAVTTARRDAAGFATRV